MINRPAYTMPSATPHQPRCSAWYARWFMRISWGHRVAAHSNSRSHSRIVPPAAGEGRVERGVRPHFKEKEKTHGEIEMWRAAKP